MQSAPASFCDEPSDSRLGDVLDESPHTAPTLVRLQDPVVVRGGTRRVAAREDGMSGHLQGGGASASCARAIRALLSAYHDEVL